MSSIQFALNDVACSSCIVNIKKKIKKLEGIEMVKVLPGSGNIQIDYNENIINEDEVNRIVNQLALRTFD